MKPMPSFEDIQKEAANDHERHMYEAAHSLPAYVPLPSHPAINNMQVPPHMRERIRHKPMQATNPNSQRDLAREHDE